MQLITSYKRYGRPTACQSACQCCSSTLSVSPQKIIWSVKLNSQLDRFGKIRGNFIKKRPVKTKIRSSRYSLVTRSSGNRNTLYAELVHIISHVCPIAIAQHGSDYKIVPVCLPVCLHLNCWLIEVHVNENNGHHTVQFPEIYYSYVRLCPVYLLNKWLVLYTERKKEKKEKKWCRRHIKNDELKLWCP